MHTAFTRDYIQKRLDENRLMYFLIKVEKVFIKYIELFGKVHIIKNRFNSEFIYSAKSLKAKKERKRKKKTEKEAFNFYMYQ